MNFRFFCLIYFRFSLRSEYAKIALYGKEKTGCRFGGKANSTHSRRARCRFTKYQYRNERVLFGLRYVGDNYARFARHARWFEAGSSADFVRDAGNGLELVGEISQIGGGGRRCSR